MGKLYGLLAARGAVKRLVKARELLENETPLKSDCGRICGAKCCQSDDTGENGMLLYPFEDRLYRKGIEGFTFELRDDDTLYKGGKRLICNGECPREFRPLKCRLFPLRISVKEAEDNSLKAEAALDPSAFAVCPLCEQGMQALSESFISAAEQAGGEMLKSLDITEALFREQEIINDTKSIFGL